MYYNTIRLLKNGQTESISVSVTSEDVFSGEKLEDIQNIFVENGWTMNCNHSFHKNEYRLEITRLKVVFVKPLHFHQGYEEMYVDKNKVTVALRSHCNEGRNWLIGELKKLQ